MINTHADLKIEDQRRSKQEQQQEEEAMAAARGGSAAARGGSAAPRSSGPRRQSSPRGDGGRCGPPGHKSRRAQRLDRLRCHVGGCTISAAFAYGLCRLADEINPEISHKAAAWLRKNVWHTE